MKKTALRQLIRENITSILQEDSYKSILLAKIKNCSLSEEDKAKMIADLENGNKIPEVAAKLEAATGAVKESLSDDEIEFDEGWNEGYKVGYDDCRNGSPRQVNEEKGNAWLKALKSDLAKLKGQDPNGYSDPKEYKALVREIEKMIKDFKSKSLNEETEDEDDASEFEKEPTAKDLKKGDSITINATKLGEITKELKATVGLWKKAEGKDKQKHLDKLKELTKLKKELEGAL